jgi:hypothetical protein
MGPWGEGHCSLIRREQRPSIIFALRAAARLNGGAGCFACTPAVIDTSPPTAPPRTHTT